MLTLIRPAAVSLFVLSVLTGIVYPVVVTAVAQVVFPYQANGSVRLENGKPVASELIGQAFSSPGYFWGRLSATGPVPYTAYNKSTLTGSSGSNLGPLNPALMDAVKQRVADLRAADPTQTGPIPVDLVTASGSGLDPQISPAAAEYQVTRVAVQRGMSVDSVRDLVRQQTEHRQLGVLGEPRVNVLLLNRALDKVSKAKS